MSTAACESWTLVRAPDGRIAVRLPDDELVLHTILGIGRNYAEHAAEMSGGGGNGGVGEAGGADRPMVFSKNAASACLDGDAIVIPPICADREQVDYEGELAFIIGTPTRDASPAHAPSAVLGYCIANDISARWWQKQGSGGQFFRGKSFDTFCPLGPHVTPAYRIPDPQTLTIETRLNRVVVQHDSTASMIFPVRELIAELSRGTTLLPGTVILTGTPAGVGAAQHPPRFLRQGDEISIVISGLGTLTNRVQT